MNYHYDSVIFLEIIKEEEMENAFMRDTTSGDSAAEFNETMRKQSNTLVNSGKEFASRELDHLYNAVRDASHRLHQDNDYFAQFADDIAGRLDSVSHYFKEKDSDQIINSFDNFAHRHPGLTIGGLLVAGFAATRFFKNGSHE
jgi:hypothetical protein